MIFKPAPSSMLHSLAEERAGWYRIATIAYMFGQHRIQVWYDVNGREDAVEIVPPNW